MGSSLIFGSNLPKYTARQQEFDRDKDARKADLALRNALQEQQMKEEGATSRQKYAVDAVLEQEKMQQAGATLRATPTMEGQNIKNDIERAYGMRNAEAGVSKIELDNSNNQLSLAFKKEIQPILLDENKAKARASIAQSKRFGTYFSGEQAKDERTAILQRFNVSPDGIVANKKSYFDDEYGAGNLASDIRAAEEEDRTGSAPRNNQKIFSTIKPDLSPKLNPRMLSRKSKLPTP